MVHGASGDCVTVYAVAALLCNRCANGNCVVKYAKLFNVCQKSYSGIL